jgi:hypothetical protein
MHKRGIKGLIKDKAALSVHLFLGLVFVVYSSMALIFQLTASLYMESVIFSYVLIELVLVALGIFLVWDTIKYKRSMRMPNFSIGFFLIFFGLFPLLVDFQLLRFLPFTIEFTVNYILLAVILFFSSLYFVVDRFLGIFRKEYS